MEEFRKLGIIEPILKSIEAQKFAEPSEIQNKAIPLVLQGKDVIAGSATGSGKTLVFGARIIQNSEQARGIQSLVLTPTRELAIQVAESLSTFSRFKRLNIISVYGGVSINPQIDRLRTADVVVGTPGRILDHAQRRTIDLRRVNVLVLDEADRMLDMGFIDDVERIIRLCPAKRQTLLFSATISSEIAGLAGRYMINPVRVSVEQYVDPKKLKQVYYDAPDNLKFSLLVHLLRNERAGLAMVFCNTQRNTDFVARNLKLNGIKVMAIHGGFSQAKRTRTMEQFHSQDVQVLVCTDVAARGLDIKGVTHIYNYDIPVESKQYIHRIGRTARAGEEGKAINILAHRDHDNFTRVLRDEDVKIEAQAMPYVERARINIPSRGERFVRHGRDFRNPRHSRNFGQSRQVRRGFRSTARA
jgi:ATP-dependent RNA helicase DeaD